MATNQEAIETFQDYLRGANEAFASTLRLSASDCRTCRLDLLAMYQRQAIVSGALLTALQDGKSFQFCRDLCAKQALREYRNGNGKLAEEWLNWEPHGILIGPNGE